MPTACQPRAGPCLLDDATRVLRAHVAADGVVEPRVVALAYDGDDDVELATNAGKSEGHPFHRGVRHLAHRQEGP